MIQNKNCFFYNLLVKMAILLLFFNQNSQSASQPKSSFTKKQIEALTSFQVKMIYSNLSNDQKTFLRNDQLAMLTTSQQQEVINLRPQPIIAQTSQPSTILGTSSLATATQNPAQQSDPKKTNTASPADQLKNKWDSLLQTANQILPKLKNAILAVQKDQYSNKKANKNKALNDVYWVPLKLQEGINTPWSGKESQLKELNSQIQNATSWTSKLIQTFAISGNTLNSTNTALTPSTQTNATTAPISPQSSPQISPIAADTAKIIPDQQKISESVAQDNNSSTTSISQQPITISAVQPAEPASIPTTKTTTPTTTTPQQQITSSQVAAPTPQPLIQATATQSTGSATTALPAPSLPDLNQDVFGRVSDWPVDNNVLARITSTDTFDTEYKKQYAYFMDINNKLAVQDPLYTDLSIPQNFQRAKNALGIIQALYARKNYGPKYDANPTCITDNANGSKTLSGYNLAVPFGVIFDDNYDCSVIDNTIPLFMYILWVNIAWFINPNFDSSLKTKLISAWQILSYMINKTSPSDAKIKY